MWKAKYAIFRQSMASASGVLMMQQRILRFIYGRLAADVCSGVATLLAPKKWAATFGPG